MMMETQSKEMDVHQHAKLSKVINVAENLLYVFLYVATDL